MSNEAAEMDQWLRCMREMRDSGQLTEFGRGFLAGVEAHEHSAGAAPLDVERLARALHVAQPHWKRHVSTFDEHREGHMDDAEKIAAEYARLKYAALSEGADR